MVLTKIQMARRNHQWDFEAKTNVLSMRRSILTQNAVQFFWYIKLRNAEAFSMTYLIFAVDMHASAIQKFTQRYIISTDCC